MELRHSFSFPWNQCWIPGCVYWISCDQAQADLAFAIIASSLVGEGIAFEADLKSGGTTFLWKLLAVLEALPKGLTLVQSDLEFLLLEVSESLDEKFRRKTLLIRLLPDAGVVEDKTAESVAVLRLARTVLADSMRFIVLDCVGEVQDYEAMGVVSLQHFVVGEPTVEEKYSSVRQLIQLGKEKGYLLSDEIFEMLPEEVVNLPAGLDEIYLRFADLGLHIIDRPERYQNRDDFESWPGAGEGNNDTETCDFEVHRVDIVTKEVRSHSAT